MWGLKLVKWGSQISDIGSPYRGRKRSSGIGYGAGSEVGISKMGIGD